MRWRARVAIGIAGLLAVACAESPRPSAAVPAPLVAERDPLSLLPDSVDSVLTVDLGRVRAAPFARPILGELAAPAAAERQARGFDEVADVDSWVFARFGAPGGERATIEIARGRFDRARVTKAFLARWPAARVTEFGRIGGATAVAQAVAIVSSRTLVLGPPWAVRTVAGVLEGRVASARTQPWLADVQTNLARARARYGAVDREAARDLGPDVDARDGDVPAPALELVLRATASTRAELGAIWSREVPIEQLGARVDLGEGARGLVLARASSDAAAAALAEDLRQTFAELRTRPSVAALGLARMFGRADVAARGSRLAISLGISAAERATVAAKLAAVGAVLARRTLPPAGHADSDASARDPAAPAPAD